MKFLLPLNKESILKFTDELSLIKFYFSEFNGLGRYNSNLRTGDTTKSLWFAYKKGKVVISDFGNPNFVGLNTFAYLGLLLNLSYFELLGKIVIDLDLPIQKYYFKNLKKTENIFIKKDYKIEEKDVSIKYRRREWFSHKKDKEFWGIIDKDFNLLTSVLTEFDAFPLSHYWINDYLFEPKDPSYIYFGRPGYKIYSPFSKTHRWVSTIGIDGLMGKKQLQYRSSTLLIEKSLKDAVIAKILFPDLDVIPMNSESSLVSEKWMSHFKSKYQTIIAHFDNDPSGRKLAELYLNKYAIETFYFDENYPKDNYDFLKQNTKKELYNILYKNLKK